MEYIIYLRIWLITRSSSPPKWSTSQNYSPAQKPKSIKDKCNSANISILPTFVCWLIQKGICSWWWGQFAMESRRRPKLSTTCMRITTESSWSWRLRITCMGIMSFWSRRIWSYSLLAWPKSAKLLERVKMSRKRSSWLQRVQFSLKRKVSWLNQERKSKSSFRLGCHLIRMTANMLKCQNLLGKECICWESTFQRESLQLAVMSPTTSNHHSRSSSAKVQNKTLSKPTSLQQRSSNLHQDLSRNWSTTEDRWPLMLLIKTTQWKICKSKSSPMNWKQTQLLESRFSSTCTMVL